MNQAIQLNSNILNDGEWFLKNVSLKRHHKKIWFLWSRLAF